MFETMVNYVMAEHLWGMTFEPPIGGPGYTRLMSHHRKPYKTLDGYIAILPYLDAHWENFCKLTGPHGADRRSALQDAADRVRNIDDTYQDTARSWHAHHRRVARDVRQVGRARPSMVNSLRISSPTRTCRRRASGRR